MTTIATPRFNEASLHHNADAAAAALKEIENEHRLELDELKRRRVQMYAAGRVLLSLLFIVSGFVKWAHFDATVASMSASGMNDAGLLLPFAIGFEIIGGAMLLAGWKTRITSWTLIGYVAFLTLLVHYDLANEAHRAQALSNIAFIGGLLMLAGHGAGKASVDRFVARRARTQSF